jgi:hypothetical protein
MRTRRFTEGDTQPWLALMHAGFAMPAAMEAAWLSERILMTGVSKTHRGRALGMSVKIVLDEQAGSGSASVLRTNTLSTNLAIRRINERLGYRRKRGNWRMRKA